MKEKIYKLNFEEILKTIIDILLCMSLIVLSIKKGGFYKEDILFIALCITGLGLIFLFYKFIIKKGTMLKKIEMVDVAIITLFLSYTFSIIFNNYTNLNDAIFELMRYVLLIVVYFIVKNSDNKIFFKISIISVALIQSIIGIDGMFSRSASNVLGLFGSGFLQKDYDRLSGTIQYANVTAILIFIAIFLIIDFIQKLVYEEKSSSNKKNSKIIILSSMEVFLLTSLILTKSRMVLFLTVLMFIIKVFKDKKKALNMIIIFNLIYAIVMATITQNISYVSSFKILIIYLIFIAIYLILNHFLYTFYLRHKEKFIKCFKTKGKYIIASTIILILGYFVLAFSITTSIKISYKESFDNKHVVELYNIKEKNNTVEILTNNLSDDANFDIKVYEVLKNGDVTTIYEANSYTSSTGKYLFEYNLEKDNFRDIRFEFTVNSGSFEIDNIKINNKNSTINYLLIPRDLVSRIQDILHGSSTINDRVEYNKDAIKIIKNSYKNILFGVGGEGFRNLYETVQTYPYYSTEAHNSYLQIFVESGILGFASIVYLVFANLKNSKKAGSNIYLAFLGLCIHMVFDLDFSYLLVILVFGVIIAIMNESNLENENVAIKKEIYCVFITLILTVSFIILVFANISNFKYNQITSKCSSSIEQNANDMTNLEKIVELDFSDITYRKKLNAEYFNYLSNLEEELKVSNIEESVKQSIEQEIESTVKLIKENTDKIYDYDKYNKVTLKYVNEVYFKYMEYFTKVYYSDNYELGKKEYTKFMQNNVEYIKNNLKLEIKYKDILNEMTKDMDIIQRNAN